MTLVNLFKKHDELFRVRVSFQKYAPTTPLQQQLMTCAMAMVMVMMMVIVIVIEIVMVISNNIVMLTVMAVVMIMMMVIAM